MRHFHLIIHARPPAAIPGPVFELDGQQLSALNVRPDMISLPFPVSFEEASERLASLPRMFVEPDGSFVWVSGTGKPAWQVDGNLRDRDGRLLFVELLGTCPWDEFQRLTAALGGLTVPLMFQMVRQALLIDESELRRWLDTA